MKKLLVVVPGTDKSLLSQLLDLTPQKKTDPEAGRVVATKDGDVMITALTVEQWKKIKNRYTEDDKILFLGLTPGMEWLPEQMHIKYRSFGITYGWLGNRAMLYADRKALNDREEYTIFLQCLKANTNIESLKKPPAELSVAQFFALTVFALIVPFGPAIAGGKLLRDWYKNRTLVHRQQYALGIFHLYRSHLQEFMDA